MSTQDELYAEHQAIEYTVCLLRWFGMNSEAVQRTKGHSGPGWYAWSWEYPEEGSAFLGVNPEIVEISKCIVEHERKAGWLQ